MSILEDLYYGRLCPSERFFEKESEYGKLISQLVKREAMIFEHMEKEDKVLYEEMGEIRIKAEDIADREIFIKGFRTGALMMLELWKEPEMQLKPLD